MSTYCATKEQIFDVKLVIEKDIKGVFMKMLKKFEFLKTLFHIGVLCSKTFDGLGRWKTVHYLSNCIYNLGSTAKLL